MRKLPIFLLHLEAPCALSLYTDVTRARWLNHMLATMWQPYLRTALESSFTDLVDTVLEKEKPRFMEAIRVSKFALGSQPPVVTGTVVGGIKVLTLSRLL